MADTRIRSPQQEESISPGLNREGFPPVTIIACGQGGREFKRLLQRGNRKLFDRSHDDAVTARSRDDLKLSAADFLKSFRQISRRCLGLGTCGRGDDDALTGLAIFREQQMVLGLTRRAIRWPRRRRSRLGRTRGAACERSRRDGDTDSQDKKS